MKELIECIAKALVDHPEAVHVTETVDEQMITVALSVDAEDKGKVIGKQGRIVKAIRSVAYAAATNQNKRVRIDIV
ncbi:KH domain-containing protein [Desertibacillus haloalkaliphilus]|uniref:KH domain-containing protein n=1 Tax=Desertibacillus haloalkaliphilus TaxID=1328930 RepID=UPI001C26F257|nr:KH domain-containing protein [Desertibacillus haloalkaliphilus]MBU8907038.1 KH domain-containing protein [Desertibacillus haloalkaliphilus]